MKAVRFIIDPPQGGALNMAIDQVLLETAEATGQATLRFYRWSEPTLSLGYFQKFEQRATHAASFDCSIVRRKTGGGAILHHHELTYSLALPHQNRWSQAHAELYDKVHSVVIQQLGEMGVASRLYGDGDGVDNPPCVEKRAFLCFQRRTSGDIVTGGWKVAGSAQRRLKKSLLQHGSILFRRSEFAPELPGIEEASGKSIDWDRFEANLASAIKSYLHLDLFEDKLLDEELFRCKEVETTFVDNAWLRSR